MQMLNIHTDLDCAPAESYFIFVYKTQGLLWHMGLCHVECHCNPFPELESMEASFRHKKKKKKKYP